MICTVKDGALADSNGTNSNDNAVFSGAITVASPIKAALIGGLLSA